MNEDSKMLDYAETSITQLESSKQVRGTGNAKSVIEFENFKCYERKSFLEYLRSGWNVSFVAAIDYTASNGNLSDPSSLHSLQGTNQY